jgi:hypothetical protein
MIFDWFKTFSDIQERTRQERAELLSREKKKQEVLDAEAHGDEVKKAADNVVVLTDEMMRRNKRV